MFRVVVSVADPRQSSHPRLGFVHVMSQLCSRVGVALAWFHILPSPGLVLVVRVIFLVLDPKPLCFLHKRPLLIF